ncbi:DUF4175 family protein [Glacieibacterium frigidum]|uniref:DUF4175 domain-containing protein n=1 Tax=Glacieibacterium frigidum TaxID=2593303 RepID=A0A552UES3_9SPHN|nr:DUF4175 family protein [Glacieibacterium frigidum]TRW16720.1 DUF4175 domain-containing protein [Glacieibacterium frigidum]
MTAPFDLALLAAPARRRGIANDLAVAVPLVLAAAGLAWRWQGMAAALAILAFGVALAAGLAVYRARRFDARWVVRRLDAGRADMEDSTDLLLAAPDALGPLQQLQRARLLARLADETGAALAPAWSGRAIAAAWTAGLVIAAAALLWPAARSGETARPDVAAVPGGPPQLVAQQLRIVPPAYTGLPPRTINGLDARAPVGSRLSWSIEYRPAPGAVVLTLLNGERLQLARRGDTFTLTRGLDRSMLYRIGSGDRGAALPLLHRIDAIRDTPPVIRVLDPERTLTQKTSGQRRWTLNFEASDDYGVAAVARLRVIVTKGEGENISFQERTTTLTGSGPARKRRFSASLDIAALGLTVGNDLVAQLIVTDMREPGPQAVRGPSLILRWPPDQGVQGSGLDGMVKTVLPAYFRSQRQIIIDAEALQRERRRLPADRFSQRSNALGVDQSILRQRYGRFLGDEVSEEPSLPTNDAPVAKPKPAAEAPAALPSGHALDDGHDHAPAKSAVFGNASDVLAEFGHTHAEGDANLIDPETRTLLRQALDAMFESERNLRQSAPDQARPHAYVALRLIKQVQEATRIYLARTGPDLPPIDPARRLTGDRKTLGSPRLAPPPREAGDIDAVPAAAWRALAGSGDVQLGALQRWIDRAGGRVGDPLALAAAIDTVARDPGCRACRDRLRGLLWQALATPPAQVQRRATGDAAGRRYLDALR